MLPPRSGIGVTWGILNNIVPVLLIQCSQRRALGIWIWLAPRWVPWAGEFGKCRFVKPAHCAHAKWKTEGERKRLSRGAAQPRQTPSNLDNRAEINRQKRTVGPQGAAMRAGDDRPGPRCLSAGAAVLQVYAPFLSPRVTHSCVCHLWCVYVASNSPGAHKSSTVCWPFDQRSKSAEGSINLRAHTISEPWLAFFWVCLPLLGPVPNFQVLSSFPVIVISIQEESVVPSSQYLFYLRYVASLFTV